MFEKLIRDLIPQLAQGEGRSLSVRQASAEELIGFHARKLIEEAAEAGEALASGSRDALRDELADLQTILNSTAQRFGISQAEIDDAVHRKAKARGAFDLGLVLDERAPKLARLHVGGSDSLLSALRAELQQCRAAGFAVAFIMGSGLDLMEGAMRAALLRGAEIKLLTTDYLDVTEPEALERMLQWHGRLEVRVFSHPGRSFHPKAYWFERLDGSGRAFIGSANFSRSGLRDGVEWTWSVLDIDPGYPIAEVRRQFDDFFSHSHSAPLSPEWIASYRERRKPRPFADATSVLHPMESVPAISPRPVQELALRELERLRADGETRALVIAATGLGKTYLAAFDAAAFDRVLFIAHRQELLDQACHAFQTLYPQRSCGFVGDGRSEIDRDIVLASVQTLSQESWIANGALADFDYVVIDEFHHAAADSYARLLAVLEPKFLLGLTATPFRGDNRDLMALCHGNVAYEVGLFDAISYGWLVPFRYYGIADRVAYGPELLNASGTGYDIQRLTEAVTSQERTSLVLEKFSAHGSKAALGFCVSIAHAQFMARTFSDAGVPAAAVHSGEGSMDRAQAIASLAFGKLRVLFTVDLFNEGVDIPSVDLVLFLRPTESMTVFLQQLGRGLRLHPGKSYLTVLDFLGNYRRAHFKLPFLVGAASEGALEARDAINQLVRLQRDGERPSALPEGVTIDLEPLALEALRESLKKASPLRELVRQDLTGLALHLGRAPTLLDVHRLGYYRPRACIKALGCKSWHALMVVMGWASSDEADVNTQAGDFLAEVERTAMTKSFKMVVLLAMLQEGGFRSSIHLSELISFFRGYFAEERHRLDLNGTDVEGLHDVPERKWEAYLVRNPVAAWAAGKFFEFDADAKVLRYTGPQAASQQSEFMRALRERVEWRLADYWDSRRPDRLEFNVIPAGDGLCVMFGNGPARASLPSGWQAVRINGKFMYGKFVQVALNVLKAQPDESTAVPNQLTRELRLLFQNTEDRRAGARKRVRLVPLPAENAWAIEAA